jgi:hypothetical protein
MTRYTLPAALLLAALLITGCGMNAPTVSVNSGNAAGPVAQPTTAALAILPTFPATQAPAEARVDDVSNSPRKNIAANQRIVLKNASLTLTVEDPARTVAQITQLAESMGGWVVASNAVTTQRNGNSLVQATITVRVPAERFSSTLEQFKAQAVSIDAENITGDDVTDKFVDLTSQLTNLESTAAQLQKIMATASRVEEVLAVQDKLTQVQGEIEAIKGQLKYYSDAAAYSLISLTLNQKAPPLTPTPTPTITPTPTPKPLGLANWDPGKTVVTAADTLVSVVQGLISSLIWLVVVIGPMVVPVGLLALVVRRRYPGKPTKTS